MKQKFMKTWNNIYENETKIYENETKNLLNGTIIYLWKWKKIVNVLFKIKR